MSKPIKIDGNGWCAVALLVGVAKLALYGLMFATAVLA